MPLDSGKVNLLFAIVVLSLGGFAAGYSLFVQKAAPTILPPQESGGMPADHPELPENHPPLDYAKQLQALEQLSQRDPRNAQYKTQIGNLYYDIRQYAKALEAYQQSLALHPQDPNVETDIGTCLHYLGQHDKALETLERVLSYSPNFPQALFNKGVVLHAGKKDPQGAIRVWEDLLRLHPNLPQSALLQQRINELKAGTR